MSGRFNLQDYATVDDRIDRYWAMYPAPEGSIQTEIIWVADDGASVAIKATVYAGARILATGIAQEERLVGTDQHGKPVKGANVTSWWENCETSAIGRALANMNMSLSRQRPSREEMEKIARYEAAAPPPAPEPKPAEAPAPRVALSALQEETIANAWALARAGDSYNATKAVILTLRPAGAKETWAADDLAAWAEINRRWYAIRKAAYPATIKAAVAE